MDEKELLSLLDKIIDNSKFKKANTQQREVLKIRMLQKFMKELFRNAFEMVDSKYREEYNKLLLAKNNDETLEFVINKIPNFRDLLDRTIKSFSQEIHLFFRESK